jgi:hypothetical protein
MRRAFEGGGWNLFGKPGAGFDAPDAQAFQHPGALGTDDPVSRYVRKEKTVTQAIIPRWRASDI